jgi:hypothetical protein
MGAMNSKNVSAACSGVASGSGGTGSRSATPTAAPPYPLKAVLFAFAVSGTAAFGQDYTTDKPAKAPPAITVPLTPEQKTALQAVDVRIAGVEALAAKVDDPAYRENCDSAIRDLKRRRVALEKNFEPGLYEALMHSVISRYQVIALWLTPPRLAPRAGNAGKTEKTGK